MIVVTSIGLKLSPAVARGLLEFASEDGAAPWLCCVGIDEGEPCATDGHAAARFVGPIDRDDGAPELSVYSRRVWPRAYVEARLREAGRGAVLLEWLGFGKAEFPRLKEHEPKDRPVFSEPVMLDPLYLGKLGRLCAACRAPRTEDDRHPQTPGATLASVGGEYDPVRYVIGGAYWPRAEHTAHVTIMPMSFTRLEAAEKLRQNVQRSEGRRAVRAEERAQARSEKTLAKEKARAEREKARRVCSQCGPGHAGPGGLCVRHGKPIATQAVAG